MTPQREALEQIQELIAHLSPEDRTEVELYAKLLRHMSKSCGATFVCAFALVGAEGAAEENG